ncbi:MAG: DUF86 domain-containing protein [Acaryochloris sp. RU_4_1]|nr:DUF86 domain-containing protein [Acaryochloris sp. RU_4_1]NJR56064.1 DUF86 domain-containing protein [Acaryochloris sp. CRU_2_0]
MRNDSERLKDILDAIAKIERYSLQGRDRFEQDELVQVWIVHHLQMVGEAVGTLSEPLTRQRSGVPWAEIVALRNVLVHEYFRVNLELVWRIVEQDLPDLKAKVEAILQGG